MSEASEFQVTFDCHDPGALALFWAAATRYVERHREDHVAGGGHWRPSVCATSPRAERDQGRDRRRNGWPSRGARGERRRVHLDVRAAPDLDGATATGVDAEDDRLGRAGAGPPSRAAPTPPKSASSRSWPARGPSSDRLRF